MKKLMLSAALAATLAGFGIESANVVGYLGKTMVTGFNAYTPMFTGIGTTSINIQNVKPIDDPGDMTTNIQLVGDDGNIPSTYVWLTEDASGFEDGWYNDDLELVDVTINPGQGFLIYTETDNLKVEVAGEVKIGDINYINALGFNAIGNASPIDVDIQDIIPQDDPGDMTTNIQIVGADGNIPSTYVWLTEEASGFEDGWYNDDLELVEATIVSGQGFLLYTETNGLVVKIPSALK